jgi:hypothetical protein
MSFDIAGIISGVKTKTEMYNMLRELDVLENSLYKTDDQGFEETLHHGVNSILSEAIQDELKNAENNTDQEVRKSLINNIKEGVNNLKIIILEIPIEPSEEMIKKIHKWITDKCGPGKILDIAVDKNIIGGARITYEGKIADCTFNKNWDEVWKQIKI